MKEQPVEDRRRFTREGDLKPGFEHESESRNEADKNFELQAKLIELHDEITHTQEDLDKLIAGFGAIFDSLPKDQQEELASRLGFTLNTREARVHKTIGFIQKEVDPNAPHHKKVPIGFQPPGMNK